MLRKTRMLREIPTMKFLMFSGKTRAIIKNTVRGIVIIETRRAAFFSFSIKERTANPAPGAKVNTANMIKARDVIVMLFSPTHIIAEYSEGWYFLREKAYLEFLLHE